MEILYFHHYIYSYDLNFGLTFRLSSILGNEDVFVDADRIPESLPKTVIKYVIILNVLYVFYKKLI